MPSRVRDLKEENTENVSSLTMFVHQTNPLYNLHLLYFRNQFELHFCVFCKGFGKLCFMIAFRLC